MNSGTFHVMGQDWRYYAREKSLIHTLHMGQLPSSVSGDSVFIEATAPTGTSHLKLHLVPPAPIWGGGNTITLVTGTICYGYYNNQNGLPLLTESKNAIVNASLGASIDVISIIPNTAGIYHISGWSYVDNGGVRMNYGEQRGFTLYVDNVLLGTANNSPGGQDYSAVGCTVTLYVFQHINSWGGLYRLKAGSNVSLHLDHTSYIREGVQLSVEWLDF